MRAIMNGLCGIATICWILALLTGCPSDRQAGDVPEDLKRTYHAAASAGDEQERREVAAGTVSSGEELARRAKRLDQLGDEIIELSERDLNWPERVAALNEVPKVMPSQPAIAADAKNWPLFRADSHSSGVAVSKLPEKLSVLWKFRVEDGGFETTPAVVDGVVYVGDFDGKLYAIDAATGDKKWDFAGELGFVASPSVYKGHVYIGDLDGKFYCVNAKSGKKVWEFATEAEIDSSANFYKDNVLIGSQDATLYCMNAADGKPVWKFTIDDQIRCTPTVVDNRCFLAGCDGKLHIVDLDKGEAVDDVPIESPTGTTPAVRGQRVYFGTHAGDFFLHRLERGENDLDLAGQGQPFGVSFQRRG